MLRIQIVEPNWQTHQTVTPEKQIPKDPYIKNIDKTPAYVFMQVTVPAEIIVLERSDEDAEKGNSISSTAAIPLFRFVNATGSYETDQTKSDQYVNAGWYWLKTAENVNSAGETESISYLYAWTGDNTDDTMAVLAPDETTSRPLFHAVMFCNAREDDALSGSIQNIKVDAFAIQSDYLKSALEPESKAKTVWQYLSERACVQRVR